MHKQQQQQRVRSARALAVATVDASLARSSAQRRRSCLGNGQGAHTLQARTSRIASSRPPLNQPRVACGPCMTCLPSCLACFAVLASAIWARSAASVDFCAWNACSAVLYVTPCSVTGS
jgi:hypothetical protein